MSADLKRVLLARNANRFESINALDPRAKNLQRLKESIAAFSQLYGQDHGNTISDEKLAKIINELKDPRSSVDQVLASVLDISDPNISTSLLLPDIISDLEKLTPTKRRSFEFSGNRSFEDKLPAEITELNADGKLITVPLSDFPEDAGAVGSARRALTYSHFPKNQITKDGYEKVSELSLDDPEFKIKYPVQYKRISKLINKTDPALSSEEYGIGIWKVASLNWDIEYFYADKNNKEFRIKDEFGNYPNHIFVLKHKSTGEKVFLGDDDIRTLFSDPWFSAERIIIDRLRSNERPSYKKRLEELRPLLYLTLDKYKSTDPSKNELIEKTEQILKKPQFTDKDLDFIDDAYFICEEVWTEKGFSHSATKFLEAYKEINHIVSNETVLKLADENHTTGLVKEKLLDVPARTITNETVNSIIDLYESLINIQKTLEVEFGLLGTPTPKEHNPRFDLGTVAGQADVKIADRIYTDLEAGKKVLNVALDGPRQLITIANAIYETLGIDEPGRKKLLSNLHDLDPITYRTYTHPNPERILGDIKTLNSNGLPENESEKLKPNSYKTITANCLFNRLNENRNAITNAFIAFENLLVNSAENPGEIIVSNPKQYQMSKTNLRDLFRIAGYVEVSPPELTSNELSDDLSTRINGNGSARNLIKKTYEYAIFRKVTPFTADEIRRKFDLLDESFFKTKSEKCKEESPTSPREDAEFILRPDYLMGLSVISNASISNQLIPGSSSIVTRRDIIHDSQYAEFEERLATLQHYSSEEHGENSHLTKREKTKLDEIIQLWDIDFSNALTRDQVAFIMTTSNKAVETKELPAKIKSNAKSNYGKKCTLWDAYKTERDSRLRFSEPSIVSIRRPGETLAERIKYAFDKRLDKYNFPCTIILENPKEISNAVFRASIPTGIAMEYSFVSDFISQDGRFMPSPPLNVSKKAASIYKSSLSQIDLDRFTGRLGFIAPSDLVNPDTLISYFKESTTFNERLFSLISNRNLNPDFLHHCFSNICEKIRVHELCTNTGIPYKEEVEALAKFFQISPEILDPLYELREATPPVTQVDPPTPPTDSTTTDAPTNPDPIPTTDPIPPSQSQINTDPLTLICPLSDTKITVSSNEEGTFIRKEISDFVEESLATLEYANKKGNLKERHVSGFNEIKRLWDEEFVLSLDRNQIATLRDLTNSKPKKHGPSLADLAKKENKKFLNKLRDPLSERIFAQISRKRLKALSNFTENTKLETIIEAFNQIGQLPAQTHGERQFKENLFSKIVISNKDGLVIAPRRLLTPDHVTQLFTDKTSTGERIVCLSHNENYSAFGFEHLFTKFLIDNYNAPNDVAKDAYSLVKSWAKDHKTYDLTNELKGPIIVALAKFLEVKPSDIDPKLMGEQLDFPTFAPEPPAPPASPTPPVSPITPTVSPSDTTSISLTCPLSNSQITITPNDAGLYPIAGMADFMEETLAVLEYAKQYNYLSYDDKTKYENVKKSWDEDFTSTFTEEQMEFLNSFSCGIKKLDPNIPPFNMGRVRDFAIDFTGYSIADTKEEFLKKFRTSLLNRIEILVKRKSLEIRNQIDQTKIQEETTAFDYLSKLFSTNPKAPSVAFVQGSKQIYRGSCSVKLDDQTKIEIGLRRLLDPKNVIDHCQSSLTLMDKLDTLFTNENLEPPGTGYFYGNFLRSKYPNDSYTKDYLNKQIELLKNGGLKYLAEFFEVLPTDIDPNYTEAPQTETKGSITVTTTPIPNEDYKLIGAVSNEEVQCLLNDRDNYRPLDYMSLEDRIKLYEQLPETVSRRDLNETVLVELFLTFTEEIQKNNLKLDDPGWVSLYDHIYSAWDQDFVLTLPKEYRDILVLAFNNNFQHGLKVDDNETKSSVKDIVTDFEAANIRINNKSTIFSRSKLAQRISTEFQRRFSLINKNELIEERKPAQGFRELRILNVTDTNTVRPGILNIIDQANNNVYVPRYIVSPVELSKAFTLLDGKQQRLLCHILNSNLKASHIKDSILASKPNIIMLDPAFDDNFVLIENSALNSDEKLDSEKMQKTLHEIGQIIHARTIDLEPACDLLPLPTELTTPPTISKPSSTKPTSSPTASKPNSAKPAQTKPTAKPPKAKPKGIVEILIEKAFKVSSESDPLLAEVRRITRSGIDSARKTPISLEELNEIINKIKSGDTKIVSKYLAQIAGKGFGERRAESNAKEIIAAIKTRVSEA